MISQVFDKNVELVHAVHAIKICLGSLVKIKIVYCCFWTHLQVSKSISKRLLFSYFVCFKKWILCADWACKKILPYAQHSYKFISAYSACLKKLFCAHSACVKCFGGFRKFIFELTENAKTLFYHMLSMRKYFFSLQVIANCWHFKTNSIVAGVISVKNKAEYFVRQIRWRTFIRKYLFELLKKFGKTKI